MRALAKTPNPLTGSGLWDEKLQPQAIRARRIGISGAHVGLIDSSGRDLDRVVVKGDLGRILAGNATLEDDPGLNEP